jgi:penicillin amidase
MSETEEPGFEPFIPTRRDPAEEPDSIAAIRRRKRVRIAIRAGISLLVVLLIAATAGFFYARYWVRKATADALPQLDGAISIPGLAAPVAVVRDVHGVPSLHAESIDDLVFAQGFVTAQDRLFQMDTIRRHAAGTLAEVLGQSLVQHDILQRTLQIRASADRAVKQLPPAQLHLLERYAAGVNASMSAQYAHLPIEFRVLRYTPEPWTPRDSMLVQFSMFEDLTNAFPVKLAREGLLARLPKDLPPDQRAELEQDLYPVGSWRDHPPTTPIPDLTIEGPPIPDVPLDDSQAKAAPPSSLPSSLFPLPSSLTPGSNNWAISGAHTASGKPLLANDMHLSLNLPGIWYSADLAAPGFHVAGVSIPGLPLIIVGHNDHIAWGVTNLGADVQDVYIETTRKTSRTVEFQLPDGTWQPILAIREPIRVKGGKTLNFEVLATHHGQALTPILNPVLTADSTHGRTLSLRWIIYDRFAGQFPALELDSAHDWPSFLAAMRNWGGPAQNAVYADDQGHIGFHAVGSIPMRGPAQALDSTPSLSAPFLAPSAMSGSDGPRNTQTTPTIRSTPDPLASTDIQAPPAPSVPQLSGPLSPVPLVPSAAHEWSGYIPFDQLPQIFDPPSGVVATANARTTPDDYPYPVTQNWGAPYRTERIYHLLARSKNLTPQDMLHLQDDIDSDFDRVLAQRLAYSLDHALANPKPAHPFAPAQRKTLHQAADLLRTFDGRMSTNSAAPSVLAATHAVLWPMLLRSKLATAPAAPAKTAPSPNAAATQDINTLYVWGERDYALEQILMHTPPRWLPPAYANWDDFLTSAVLNALTSDKAPADLATWRYGALHTVDIESPIFDQSELLRDLLGRPTGTGPQPISGDGTTVKQIGRNFGPSERFTADFSNLNNSTLNLVLGQSGNPDSPYYLDQFPAWLHGTTFPLLGAPAHTLTLQPKN